MPETLSNVHPGEVLLEEFLKPLGLSQNKLAREIKVPPRRVNEIALGKRSITPETALRLARYHDDGDFLAEHGVPALPNFRECCPLSSPRAAARHLTTVTITWLTH